MTQIATVEKILPGGFVEISVPRKSACGHDCEECAGCGMTGAAIHARAKDPVGVRPGQKVVVESATRKILGVVALVYLLPVVGFLLGYFLSEGLAEGVRYAIAIGAAALGVFLWYMLFVGRRAARHGETGDLVEVEAGTPKLVAG